jgi:hypothetical protein
MRIAGCRLLTAGYQVAIVYYCQNDFLQIVYTEFQSFFPYRFAMKGKVNSIKSKLLPGIFAQEFKAVAFFPVSVET